MEQVCVGIRTACAILSEHGQITQEIIDKMVAEVEQPAKGYFPATAVYDFAKTAFPR